MKNLLIYSILLLSITYKVKAQITICAASDLISSWTNLGPFDDSQSHLARVTALYVDPVNNNKITIGTRGSGMWQTLDGGSNWINLFSSYLPPTGVNEIVNAQVFVEGPSYTTSALYGFGYFASTLNRYDLGLVYFDPFNAVWEREPLGNYPVDFDLQFGKPELTTCLEVRPGTDELWVSNKDKIFVRHTNSHYLSPTENYYEWNETPVLDLNTFATGNVKDDVWDIDFAPTNSNFVVVSPHEANLNEFLFSANANDINPDWYSISPIPEVLYGVDEYLTITCNTYFESELLFYSIIQYKTFLIADNSEVDDVSLLCKFTVTGGVPVLTKSFPINVDPINEWVDFTLLKSDPSKIVVGMNQDKVYIGTIPIMDGATCDLDYVSYFPYCTKGSIINTHGDIRVLRTTYDALLNVDKIYIGTDGGTSLCTDYNLLNTASANDDVWVNLNGEGLTMADFENIESVETAPYSILAIAVDGNSWFFDGEPSDNEPNPLGTVCDAYKGAISIMTPNSSIVTYNSAGWSNTSSMSFNEYNMSTGARVAANPKVPRGDIAEPEREKWTFPLIPIEFYIDNNEEFIWTGTNELYRNAADTFRITPTESDWFKMTRVFQHNTLHASEVYQTNSLIPTFARFEDIENPNKIYMYNATYKNRTGIDPTTLESDTIKLVYTIFDPDDIGSEYKVNNITPGANFGEPIQKITGESPTDFNQIDKAFITGMAVDFNYENVSESEIWVCFGSNTLNEWGSGTHPEALWYIMDENNISRQGKVYYSDDNGETWQNRSAGLPNYPVMELVYWEGSDDVIFAATGIGVYVWNKSANVWECFNENLPLASAGDIEINYCSMNLRTCLYGYGIWETPLPNLQADAPLSYNPTIITTDITWTTTRDAYTDIIIKPGAKLTIQNCEIRMPKNGKIIVENGGMLVVDGATIINYCDFWDGIQVWGKGNTEAHPIAGDIYSGAYPVDAGDHGVVRLLNDAKIAMAKTAIATLNAAEGSNPAYYGGIILANEADFLNNIISIDMRPFDTGAYNTDDDNIASFAYCNFTRNNDLPEATDNLADVYLNDVDGVNFDVCHFLNTFTNCTSVNDTPEGIASTNATFAVTSELCLVAVGECIIERSSFEGYYRGINAGNSVLCPLLLKLNGVDFTNNERGVLFSGIPSAQVTRCNFYVPDYTDKASYGLYLETSFNYHIEGNYFTSLSPATSSSFYSSGIFVENNSNKATEIYRNTFKNIEIGIRSQGNNSKLQLTCNSFLPPDIGAAGFIYNIIVTSGVLGNQGICNATITAPAGNKFSPGFHPESEFRIVPVGVTLNYRHHTESVCIPTQYTASQITLQNCGVSVEGDCPSTLPDEPTGGELRIISEAALAIEDAGNLLEVIQIETAKIDGGSTATLISDVLTNVSPTTLVEQLNEASPYISNEVFSTLVSAEPLATADMLTVLNLNYPIADTVGELITTSNYEVPEPIVDFLTDNIINDTLIASGYTDLLATIDILNTDRTQLLTDATYAYIASEKIDSATLLLASENDDWANQTLIELALIQNDLSQAETLLSNYIAQADPNFATLNSLLVDLKQSERTIMEITAPEESLLRSVATKEYPSGVAAQHILNELFNEAYPEVIDDIPAPLYRVAESTQFTINENFKIYPNPADDILFLQIMDNNAQAEKIITMYSLTGIKQQSITMPALSSWTWIDCTTMVSGIYIIEVLANGKTLGAQKVVIE